MLKIEGANLSKQCFSHLKHILRKSMFIWFLQLVKGRSRFRKGNDRLWRVRWCYRPCICDYCIIEDVQYQKISLYFPSQACQSWIRSQCQFRSGKFCWNDVLHTNILKLSMFIPLVFSRKRLNKTEVSSWNLSFSCKGNGRSPKRHRKPVYGSQILSSKIERLMENFLKSRSGNAASIHIMRTSLSNSQNLTLVRL